MNRAFFYGFQAIIPMPLGLFYETVQTNSLKLYKQTPRFLTIHNKHPQANSKTNTPDNPSQLFPTLVIRASVTDQPGAFYASHPFLTSPHPLGRTKKWDYNETKCMIVGSQCLWLLFLNGATNCCPF
jgi:hypothetical protein